MSDSGRYVNAARQTRLPIVGHAPENLAILHHIALNLLKQDRTEKRGIKNKRLAAGWDHHYLLRVVMGAKNEMRLPWRRPEGGSTARRRRRNTPAQNSGRSSGRRSCPGDRMATIMPAGQDCCHADVDTPRAPDHLWIEAPRFDQKGSPPMLAENGW